MFSYFDIRDTRASKFDRSINPACANPPISGRRSAHIQHTTYSVQRAAGVAQPQEVLTTLAHCGSIVVAM